MTVAGQETWERKDNHRGEGGVGFLVCECIAEKVEYVRYEESVWMKVRGGIGKEALYICFVYMPTEGSVAAVIENSFERLKEDVLE